MSENLYNPINSAKLQRVFRERNFILLSDAYKLTHYFQYPPDTEVVYSYMEPRVGSNYDDIVWCGLQYILKDYNFIGAPVTREMIEEADYVSKNVFGYDL
jgi:nicotinamide phosphoribosyltransferase